MRVRTQFSSLFPLFYIKTAPVAARSRGDIFDLDEKKLTAILFVVN
ncbi:unnamed protein product [Ciceribacter sp. T2.26MG-112.2]|nr:unnamed protein product [Ciceribacter naphthalenivorans]